MQQWKSLVGIGALLGVMGIACQEEPAGRGVPAGDKSGTDNSTDASNEAEPLTCTSQPPTEYRVEQTEPDKTDAGFIYITTDTYRIAIDKFRFRYAIDEVRDGQVTRRLVEPHDWSGLRYGNGDVVSVHRTRIEDDGAPDYNYVQLGVLPYETGEWGSVKIYPRSTYAKIVVEPPEGAADQIYLRTGGLGATFGAGDPTNAVYSANLLDYSGPGEGLAESSMSNASHMRRWISSFVVSPSKRFAQVVFADGPKIVHTHDDETRMGVQASSMNNAYIFVGDMDRIYCDYKAARDWNGYGDAEPKLRMFETGYETWGALRWNADQASVQDSINEYLDDGFPLRWAVVGSGFWRGDRTDNRQGTTTSFGLWDDTFESGRNDGLANPRFPNPNAFKTFFSSKDIKLMLGLRVVMKTPDFADSFNDGDFSRIATDAGYMRMQGQGPRIFENLVFPKDPVHLLNTRDEDVVEWFTEQSRLWGVDGFKEDTMLSTQFGSDDGLLHPINEALVDDGDLVMVRNGAYGTPGHLVRAEDSNYEGFGSYKDRTAVAVLSMAASGADRVYVDVIGGSELPVDSPLNADQRRYFVRSAQAYAVMPGMAVGLAPQDLPSADRDAFRSAARWHTKFAPYIYSAAVEGHRTGYPSTLTPLPIAFPDDAATHDLATADSHMYQWMLGPSLMAAPLFGEGYADSSREVYLPEGVWINYSDGTRYEVPRGGGVYSPNIYSGSRMPLLVGGKGVITFRRLDDEPDAGKLLMRVYPVAMPGLSQSYTFHDEGGESSTLHLNHSAWNAGSIRIRDITTGSFVETTQGSESNPHWTFAVTPGHDYEVVGGGAEHAFCMTSWKNTFVTSEADRRTVRARAGHCLAWEMHRFIDVNGGELRSGDTVYIRAWHDRYWTARPGGELHAIATTPRAWERFEIVRDGAEPGATIDEGDKIQLRGYHGKWVVTEPDLMVEADRDAPNAWETFALSR